MNAVNPIFVVLLGKVACSFQSSLERNVTSTVSFLPVPDLKDRETVNQAMARAHVVIGGWPAETREARHVRLVQHVGAGVEGYQRDLLPPSAYLCNVYEHEAAVAEHIWMLLLALRRKLLSLDDALRHGRWNDGPPVPDIAGMVMGVVGFGRIAHSLIPGASAFEIDLIGIAAHRPVEAPRGVCFLGGPESLDRVLTEADVVVLSCPLNDKTRGLIGKRELGLMKRSALLINVARGPVVDEQALWNALRDRQIAGAGIDTWYCYPETVEKVCLPSQFPFQELTNVIMTPHIGGWSIRTRERRLRLIANNIDRVARNEAPLNIVWEPAG